MICPSKWPFSGRDFSDIFDDTAKVSQWRRRQVLSRPHSPGSNRWHVSPCCLSCLTHRQRCLDRIWNDVKLSNTVQYTHIYIYLYMSSYTVYVIVYMQTYTISIYSIIYHLILYYIILYILYYIILNYILYIIEYIYIFKYIIYYILHIIYYILTILYYILYIIYSQLYIIYIRLIYYINILYIYAYILYIYITMHVSFPMYSMQAHGCHNLCRTSSASFGGSGAAPSCCSDGSCFQSPWIVYRKIHS